ncbi:polysaccharide export outer membrane protein [Variovorax boronicumulans]|uniref:polysaccharide biosynthesis/export family protein n=1 Tax=Variovorax boronicumulans TaxID=436515 RepID=UPI002780455D|nr:polysaccharide biosynthesis/export family protein [Variovorax boronicumulans]MDQ0035591.1 polysaccharide export outer membrane protein [Variovorax boronicumulans]
MNRIEPASAPQGARVPFFTGSASLGARASFAAARVRWLGLSMLVSLGLCGCAPGFGTPGLLRSSDGSVGTGKVTTITPELIQAQSARNTGLPAEVRALFGRARSYTIGPGDVVGVIVYDHPELLPNAGAVIAQQSDPTGVTVAPGFIVDAAGEISFPYIGRTKLQGLTESEASELIARRIRGFVKAPQVSVRIQSFRSQRAYVEGEVRAPGLQIFTDVPMTLSEALNRAGSITAAGDRSQVLLTRGDRTVAIDLLALKRYGADANNIPLRNGDVVYVGARDDSRVYVMGEILRPSALLMRNGRLSLNEALGDAGGPDLFSSDPGQIYVIRNARRADSVLDTADATGASGTSGTSDGPEIFNINAKNPAALALADRFELKPRDVVYVDRVPLVSWNRVASLILPAAQVVNLARDTARSR